MSLTAMPQLSMLHCRILPMAAQLAAAASQRQLSCTAHLALPGPDHGDKFTIGKL